MWPVGLMRTLDKREGKVEVIQEEQERGCGDEMKRKSISWEVDFLTAECITNS
jgi:hypothetical protein